MPSWEWMVRDSAKIRWTQPFDLMGYVSQGDTLPCEFFLDLDTFSSWNPLGSAASVLELVEFSPGLSENSHLVLNPTFSFRVIPSASVGSVS